MLSTKISSSDSKSTDDPILQLINPLTVDRLIKKNTLELDTSSSLNQDPTFTILQPKPTSKPDKKLKKVGKDENLDSEINKFKPKKKIRTKVSFDDELDSVPTSYANSNLSDDKISITLARPAKPEGQKIKPYSFTKLSETSKSEKKLKISSKKGPEELTSSKDNEIVILEPITVDELSNISSIPKSAMIKSLFLKGILVTANQLIDPSIAQKLGEEFGIKISLEPEKLSINQDSKTDKNTSSIPRPPIVTVMGHVDHGKTTLLDNIRKTQYAQKEIGGITQKIGAYEVKIIQNSQERKIVFLDTPGHEAFSKMRSRGISVSDIAVLVVAADDGIRPQTLEALQQIKEAKIPLIVAINKIDKDNANIESIKKELTSHDIVSEEWGGDTLMVPISALQGTNIDKLLETILLVADLSDIRANPESQANGIILESNLDKTRGAIASIIVKEGSLKIGDIVIADDMYARIRGMMDTSENPLKVAIPSSAITIWGLPKVPVVGSQFLSFKNEKDAKVFLDSKIQKSRPTSSVQSVLNNLDETLQNKKQINLIIKADSQGSLEAITSNILKQYTSNVQIRIVQQSIGEITETDLEFASASKSNILAFNSTYASGVRKSAKNTNVNIKEFSIVYDLFDHIEFLINEKIGPQYEEKLTGICVVKTVFPLAKSFVAGTSVLEGKILKTSFIKVIRDSDVIYKGYIDSLKKIKEDVSEVSSGFDCGIFVKDFGTWKSGDTIQAYNLVEKKNGPL
jgi:translation initiation factor IF-2